jgi:transcriptional regulator with XRE-family HTH domain
MTSNEPRSSKRPRDRWASRLVLLRLDMGLSQKEIAELCGIKRPTWATWENGAIPRNQAEVARKITQATGYDRDWLLFGDRPDC